MFNKCGLNICSSEDLKKFLLFMKWNLIFQFEFDIDINPNKLFEKNIDIEVNNNRIMRITQTESDKVRNGIGLKNFGRKKGNVDRNDLISEGDFCNVNELLFIC
ncbi:MAG: hypothetical protein L6V91_10465 [Bacilli bacterium]|nr:MAG: hypothetical protein L6V91_10465 [Bacilli bacterium]